MVGDRTANPESCRQAATARSASPPNTVASPSTLAGRMVQRLSEPIQPGPAVHDQWAERRPKLQRLLRYRRGRSVRTLSAARLRLAVRPRSQALEELTAIPRIGPFSAEPGSFSAAQGDPDFHAYSRAAPRPSDGDRLRHEVRGPPSAAEIAEISEVWKPYRTWVAPSSFCAMLEDETHENCRTSHHQNALDCDPVGPTGWLGSSRECLPRRPTSRHRSRPSRQQHARSLPNGPASS